MKVQHKLMSIQKKGFVYARKLRVLTVLLLALLLYLPLTGCSKGGEEDPNIALIKSYIKADFEIGVEWGGKEVTEEAGLDIVAKIMGEMKDFLSPRGLETYIDNRQFKRRSVYTLKNGVEGLKIGKMEVQRKKNDSSEDKPSYSCTLFYTGKHSDGTTKTFKEEREILMEKMGQKFKIRKDTLFSTKVEP